MSLHRTDFSPLDHGTPRKRPGLIADLAMCVPLLIGIAAALVYGMAVDCWDETVYLITGKRPKRRR